MDLVLAIDQGTTGSQAALFDARDLSLVAHAKVEYPQHYPKTGHVEHDLHELWSSVVRAYERTVELSGLSAADVRKSLLCIGVTNQRETTCAWNKRSGEPAGRAIVWQDRRTADQCAALKANSATKRLIERTTGLVVDPYFSATKMQWILENNSLARQWALKGELALGTIDSYLIFKLSGKARFVSDHTNASRTMLYDLESGRFSPALSEIFNVPVSCLAEIVPSSSSIAATSQAGFLPDGIPITGCLGDQQASLFGHGADAVGEGKITFGTGSFLLAPVPARLAAPPAGLLCSVGYSTGSERRFVVEGSVFIAAAALQYLRDKFGWFSNAAETEDLARSVERDPELAVIPAFTGFGAPYWNPNARAAILGLSLGTTREQIIRATLEAIAMQNVMLTSIMGQAIGGPLKRWGVDGGASNNNLLMQFQSDVLQAEINRPQHTEMTALGAARAALLGLARTAPSRPALDRSFRPSITTLQADTLVKKWQRAAELVNQHYPSR